jgi:hypothetical protein
MPTTRNAQITIRARDVGEHFGTQGLVYRSGRIIHRTSPPRPYGFRAAAITDAKDWAIARGYVDITEEWRAR